jgi:3'-5' exoribonuclease
MGRRWIKELKDGDLVEEVFYVADRQLRANRNAALYLSADLRDRTGTINARQWNVTESSSAGVQSGGYAKVRGKAQLYQGTLQLILSHITPVPAEGLNAADFESGPSADVTALLDELRTMLRSLQRPDLRTLVELFLQDGRLMQLLTAMPAGVKAHHAYRGGLLEHLVSLSRSAARICEVYEMLDRDLLMVGVFLHDLGKLRELSCESGFTYTDEGQLLGHLVIGVEMLTEKVRQWETERRQTFPQELLWRLKHMILSHHGSYEFGSPKLPMTLEAIALHLLDNLDAKIHEFQQAMGADPGTGSHWTLFQPRLDRKLFKGAPLVPAAAEGPGEAAAGEADDPAMSVDSRGDASASETGSEALNALADSQPVAAEA